MIELILSRKRTVNLALIFILAAGLFAYIQIPKESDPDITIPTIYVSMYMEGVSPEDAERLLVRPMEQELANVEGVKEMTATASQNSASVTLEFEAGFDPDAALADVREKVDLAGAELPQAAEEPTVHEVNLSQFPVIVITLSGDVPERALTKIAKDLGDELEGISQVLEARVIGDREEVVEVIIDPTVLRSYNLSQGEIIGFVSRNNKIVAAGNMDKGNGRFAVKVPGLFKTAQEVMDIPVKRDGDKVIRLADVATVRRTFKDRSAYARLNGEYAIGIEVSKRAGENVLDTIAGVKAKVEELRPIWPENLSVTYSQDKSTNIRDMLLDLQNNVLSAIILVMIVVIIALGVRSSLLVGIAIPGSFLAGVLFLFAIGLTVNIVVLFSLIMAVGMLVDGAIVVTEFADRKMAEGLDRSKAYAEASKRMALPIIASTLTTLAAFAPLLFWPGIVGEFMKYLPITLIATLSASLAMALIFVPTLGASFGKPNDLGKDSLEALDGSKHVDLTTIEGFTGSYARLLDRLIRHPFLQLVSLVAIFIVVQVAYSVWGHGIEFFPDVEPEFASMNIRARGNLSVDEADALVRQVESRIQDVEGLKYLYTRADPNLRAQNVPEDTVGVIQFEFTHWESRPKASEIFDIIRERTADLAGIHIEFAKPDAGPPVGKPVQLQLSSAYPEELKAATQVVVEKFESIDGLIDITDTRGVEGFEWEVQVDRTEAARYGADITVIGNEIQMLTNGVEIGEYRPLDADDEVEIRARYPFNERNLDELNGLKIVTEAGLAPVSNFITQTPAPRVQKIDRVEQRRVYTVAAEVEEGVQPAEVFEELREWLPNSGLNFNHIKVAYRGEDEEQKEAEAFLGKAFVIAVFAIAIILITQFNSVYQAGLILTAVVFSTFGVFIGLLVMNQPFGIVMNGIGVISLAGIVVNNNIVLIDTFNHHRKNIADPYQAALLTAAQRLRPVLLTTVTTILGLIPMVFGINLDFFTPHVSIGAPSTQWWSQLATSVAFGLAFATVLTLVLTPSLLACEDKIKGFIKRKG
ncbi:efflux RND transporter permease subunit [Pelagicoccus sp. SDUM812003]|uniref:efflux RND transporter permease subunit n=1 Tax=Pelagicoccus sp. SDUM812003 TaxID=3041267 RepID=UPI00280DA67B|nr:efflux RND transporter permease subunit [Pelagicoccus sp. SDUM812003]MDQ8205124.1 efflux RND transporter permease subunit [Pelagicoccus sp. SDUM812003]